MDLIATAASAREIAKFVEAGELSNAVADLGIEAAEDALSKVHRAEDKRAQVWSAVNHLEAAQAAVGDAFQRGKLIGFYLRLWRLHDLLGKRAYIFQLQAICYRYLGEKELMDRALSAIDYIHDVEMKAVDWNQGNVVTSRLATAGNLLNPLNWIDLVQEERQSRRGSLPSYEKNWLQATGPPGPGEHTVLLRKRLNATWQEAPGDLVNFRK